MTNKEYLASLPTEEFFSTIFWMINDYLTLSAITRDDVERWLDKEYSEECYTTIFPWIREQNKRYSEEDI